MDPYETHGFWNRGTITAGIILALVLLAGVVVVVAEGNHSTHNHSAAAHSGAGATTTTTTLPTKSTGCNVPAGIQSVPDATPQHITWQLFDTVALPYSSSAGPKVVDGDVARCYAHSPLGALLALSQIGIRYLLAPDWRAVVAAQIVPSAGATYFSKERARVSSAGDQAGDYEQLAGFKFVSYSKTTAVIDIVSRSDSGALQAVAGTVQWVGGDWKLALQPDGGIAPSALPVTSLVGFSQWAGV